MASTRRNADGSLQIDHYRCRARRLRYMARRRAWVALRKAIGGLSGALARLFVEAPVRVGGQRV